MKQIIVPTIFTAALICASSAAEANPRYLKGDYGFTGTAVCLISPAGFNQQLQPNGGGVHSHSFSVEGIRIFNGDGTGTVKGREVGVTPPPTDSTFPPSADAHDFSFSFTYRVGNDGSWASTMMPNSYQGTYVAGPRTGQTVTVDAIPPVTGLVSDDGKALTAVHMVPTLETHRFSNGDVLPMICQRSRWFIALSPDN